jgi:RNA polymerase-binding transcription factor DksA
MDKSKLDRIEKRLTEERDSANDSLSHVEDAALLATDEDGDITRYPTHQADQGTDTIEQETAMVLLTQDSERLTAIDAALLRLMKEPEEFGKCVNCGKEIPFERLDLIPWAQQCADCQSRMESSNT